MEPRLNWYYHFCLSFCSRLYHDDCM